MKYFLNGKEVELGKPFSYVQNVDERKLFFYSSSLNEEDLKELVNLGVVEAKAEETTGLYIGDVLDYYGIQIEDLCAVASIDPFALYGIYARILSDYFQDKNEGKHGKIVFVLDLVDDKVVAIPWMGKKKAIRVAWFADRKDAEAALEALAPVRADLDSLFEDAK